MENQYDPVALILPWNGEQKTAAGKVREAANKPGRYQKVVVSVWLLERHSSSVFVTKTTFRLYI